MRTGLYWRGESAVLVLEVCGLGGGRWRGRQQLRPGVVWYVWPVRMGVSGGSRGPLPASLLLGRCITSVWGLRGQKARANVTCI